MTHIAANSSAPRRVKAGRALRDLLERHGQGRDPAVSQRDEHSPRLLSRLAEPAVTRDNRSILVLNPEDHDLVVGRLPTVGSRHLLSPPERPDWHSLESKLGLVR